MSALKLKTTAHVIDVLGNVIGRDQPILRLEKALEMVSLLSNEVFEDNEVVFFDPFCKAGELLLACAIHSCWAKTKKKLLSTDMIFNEIYMSNRYFGLAPDERHHKLSIRTFLGNTHSHNENFNHIIRDGHYLSETDGRLDENKFETEFNSMIEYIKKTSRKKKIIAVGNPPYQEEDGGAQKSAKPIYNIFVDKLIQDKRINEFVIVIPSRWFAGGKGLDEFRSKMISSTKIKVIKHFEKAGDIFPTVDIDGGVCFVNWKDIHNAKPVFISNEVSISLNLEGYDIIPDDPFAFSLIEKIKNRWNGKYVSDVAWSGKPFGLRTFWFDRNSNYDSSKEDAIPCLYRNKQIGYVKKNKLIKNIDKINLWKVCIPNAYGGKKGDRRITLPASSIFILPIGWISTETYNVVGAFDNEQEALKFVQYLQTDFVRYFLGLRKITQHIPKDRWAWVPYLDMSKGWSNEKIYNYFKFSKKEIEHIKKKIEEWS